ncbi:macrolide ABC transporter permease/ATP-binding protein MacB, partial [Salmonella enterica subsp. enterica serovar Enteritidis]|nr:macrolide ABC transporter permease/ATP-binding protein MacB [Salmonella enterica subsp. enterica serovar Enteritidis]
PTQAQTTAAEVPAASASSWWRSYLDRFREAARMALLAMNAHRMRAFLTMPGIIIGVAPVVLVPALGKGSQARVLKDINRLGTNTLEF